MGAITNAHAQVFDPQHHPGETMDIHSICSITYLLEHTYTQYGIKKIGIDFVIEI